MTETISSIRKDHHAGLGDHMQAVVAEQALTASLDLEDDDEIQSTSEPSASPLIERDEHAELRKLMASETRTVQVWQHLVLLLMLALGGVVTTLTYRFLSGEVTSNFENSFRQIATTVVESSSFAASSVHRSFHDFAAHLTSYAVDTAPENPKTAWPFVVYPDFDIHGKNLLEQAGGLNVFLVVLVDSEERQEWEAFAGNNSGWAGRPVNPTIRPLPVGVTSEAPTEVGDGPWAIFWQSYPVITFLIGSDYIASGTFFASDLEILKELQEGFVSISVPKSITDGDPNSVEPVSSYKAPIFDTARGDDGTKREVVAVIERMLEWRSYFENLLPDDTKGVIVVLTNTFGQAHTWTLQGKTPVYLGNGDLHDSRYNYLGVQVPFNPYSNATRFEELGGFLYDLHIYPSLELEEGYSSRTPLIITIVVGMVFLLMGISFAAYNTHVGRRNNKVMENAARSNAIVTSMFPGMFRDLIIQDEQVKASEKKARVEKQSKYATGKGLLQTFMSEGGAGIDAFDTNDVQAYKTKPIADFFLSATIMFANIVGFTAWSSSREPSQVFILLETVYAAMDKVAKQRRVFKVETVGDCYVAVCGVPDQRIDHAVVMARFSRACLATSLSLMKQMEVTLGPDTGDLSVRVGLHSGPVVAGVLRGERSRFQLFGDTMNTTSRIESSGMPNKIHLSEETAKLLRDAGKASWIVPRHEKIEIRGKGVMQTYWLRFRGRAGSAASSQHSESEDDPNGSGWASAGLDSSKTSRLIEWQVDVLSGILKQIVARRNAAVHSKKHSLQHGCIKNYLPNSDMPLIEVREIISLPKFDASVAQHQDDPEAIVLDSVVVDQLRSFVATVAEMYHNHPFHNFEHASHVTMSVVKLLSRIVMPVEVLEKAGTAESMESSLHDHTYGITSDPLTQFAVVLSALMHDADHPGVSNSQLVREKPEMALAYRNKSIAEQNSVDLCWELLMQDEYKDLQGTIFKSKEELVRFRQLVVNTVLATDIMDKDLKVLRNARWEKAFTNHNQDEDPQDTVNRKATIVIEHLIQASDVAHTMQHWHVYRKWNERLFRELYVAYKNGQAEANPADFWAKGELGFFDFYIIPLAKKLKECGVFGISSDEYLQYAKQNRLEWEQRGEEIVAEMMEAIQEEEANGSENEKIARMT